MALHDRIQQQRDRSIAQKKAPVPDALQGVTKQRIRQVLAKVDRNHPDIVDAVFALLDNVQPSWFAKAPPGVHFCEGASTAHIACHVGILQRGKGKLDREGRDYWLKPLWEIGAIDKVYFDSASGSFLDGHPVPKSSNSAYRLAQSFVDILRASDNAWKPMLNAWIQADAVRERLEVQACLAAHSRAVVDTKHSDLIRSAISTYVPRFLPGFQTIYVDETDGDRITSEDRRRLSAAGIELLLGDAMPDVLLWHPEHDWLWVIEAVTSDGEVDFHKYQQLSQFAKRCGKPGIGFTTAYPTWKIAAIRQRRHKNIYPTTYLWIQEDPSKHFLASTHIGFVEAQREANGGQEERADSQACRE